MSKTDLVNELSEAMEKYWLIIERGNLMQIRKLPEFKKAKQYISSIMDEIKSRTNEHGNI